MKKVLIIGYFWPYRGGSGRMLGLAKYLPEFGWEPIILTGPLNKTPDKKFRYVVTKYRDILSFWRGLFKLDSNKPAREQVKKQFGLDPRNSFVNSLINWFKGTVSYPDIHIGWKEFAIEEGINIFQKEKIDSIISVWPVTSHFIAKELKEKYGVPWVADFPDLWSLNHNYPYGPIRRILDRNIELKTLCFADQITVVSEPWAKKMRKLHEKNVQAFPNGFDPIDMQKGSSKLTKKFTITYTGTIYVGNQNPITFFIALKELIEEGVMDSQKIEVRFYGYEQDWLKHAVNEQGLDSVVKIFPSIPREEVMEKQRESQLLLLLNWEDSKEKGVYPLKLFEYMAAKRPILATGGSGDDVVKYVIDETRVGIYCPTVGDIKHELCKFYKEYELKNHVSYTGNIQKVNNYSYREMARKFAKIMDGLIPK